MAHDAARPALLERETELSQAIELTHAVRERAGRFVVIEGPPGIGKTSILAAAREAAGRSGLRVLRARGTEIERSYPYGVVRQLLERPVTEADAEQKARLLAAAAGHARPLFEPGEPSSGASGDDAAFALVHGLYWLTLNLAEETPLLLAIDDLQWADDASLRWIAYLARRLEAAPVGVLATVRSRADEDPVLAELLADPETALIRPGPLSAEAVREMVRVDLAPQAADEFCRACHRTTGGNPLLLHELVRTLRSEGVEPSPEAAKTVERLAPDAVARSVKVRLSRTPPEAAALARAVAVLGDDVQGSHAAALAGIEKRDLAPAAAALARADLLQPDPPLRFVHPVVRNAVYELTPAHERAESHARAARVLVDARAQPQEVAAQLLNAPAGAVEDAARALRYAAKRAAAEGASAAVTSYLRRALEEELPDAERADVLHELAAAEFKLGAPAAAEHFREALELDRGDDPERRALIQLELGRALYWSRQEEAGVRVLEAAIAEHGEAGEVGLGLLAELISNAARLPSQYEAARARLEELRLDPSQGPGARTLLGMQAYAAAAEGTGRDRAADLAAQVLAAMTEEERGSSYVGSLYTLLFADRLDEGMRFIDVTLAHARSRGAMLAFSGMAMMRAIFGYARGCLVEAEADARMALEALRHRGALFTPHTHGWLIQILVERGALDEAGELLRRAEALLGPIPKDFAHIALVRARGTLAAARGDHATALADAMANGQALAELGHDNPAVSYPGWRSEAALAHHAEGHDEAALELAAEELRLAREWGAPRALGRALRVHGLIRGGKRGLDELREAVRLLDGSPARLEHAYAVSDLGAALRRANKRADARDHLRVALELAERAGAVRLAQRTRDDLLATGARPRRAVLSGVDSLTPSERRTAGLAAEGMTNKEIAQALFVTLRTVEMHLSNAFRKLDISSRTQLADALAGSES